MEVRPVTHAVTKSLIVLIFWMIFLLSLYLEEALSFYAILFALIKAVVVCGIFWVLFAMLVDTFLKSMLASAKEKKVDRVRGGLSYHLVSPSAEELAWKKAHQSHENSAGHPVEAPKKK